ncbi:MAG: sugar ABC transporter substrate-binding protein [Intestinibacillus sp.]
MTKRLLSMVLAGALCVSLTACGGSAGSSGNTSTDSTAGTDTAPTAKPLKIGVIAKYQHEFYMTMFEGAKKAAGELGAEIECNNPSSPSDAMVQVQQVEDMIAKGINVLVIVPNQPDTLSAALAKAHEKGVTIVAADTDFDYEYKVAYAGTGNEAAGSTVAEKLCEKLPENASVVVMRGPLGGVSFDQRVAGVTKTLEEKGVKVLEVVDAESVADKAAAKTEDLIQKYGDKMNAIICLDDNMTPGAVTAIRQAGMTDKILVTGFDAGQSVLEMIKSGEVLLDVAQNPYDMGYEAVKAGVASHNGEQVEPVIDTGVTVIDASNVDQHLKK